MNSKYIPSSLFLIACLCVSRCNSELNVKTASICDDFSEKCTQGPPENGVYNFKIPREKTRTWFDLSYYMYFHSRQTPGMRVELTRNLKEKEHSLQDQAACFYKLQKGDQFAEHKMEGLRWDDGGFWCFDYLGSMLVNFHKKYDSIQSRPRMDFFPVQLTIAARGPFNVEKTETIRLDWSETE